MARLAVAVAVVIALAVGVWMLWPDDERGATTTEPLAASTTTISSTTTEPAPTTTEDDHIVETVEEAEEILREFWLGWYGGFYRRDAELIRSVVATEEEVASAVANFDLLTFTRAPMTGDFTFAGTEILRSDSSCLVIWSEFTPPFLEPIGTTGGVHVFRRVGDSWKSLRYWKYRDDLWEDDCSVVFQ